MGDRFLGLGHDAVIRSDHQHDNVGDLGATRAHRGKGLVTRRIQESNLPALDLDLIGADMLRYTTGLALGDPRRADQVKQLGLTVVDMTHDHDDGRSWAQVAPLPQRHTHRRCYRSGQPSAQAASASSRSRTQQRSAQQCHSQAAG